MNCKIVLLAIILIIPLSWLLLPFFVFAQTVELEELGKIELSQQLLLSENETQFILHTLIKEMTQEFIESDFGYSSPEKLAVPLIVKKAAQINALRRCQRNN